MKKILLTMLGLLVLPVFALASSTLTKTISLAPGWNMVSTPAVLDSLSFSNGGEGISFTTLKDGSWTSVPATVENIKPLDGFLVRNDNSSTVTLTLNYKDNLAPSESILQKNLSQGWNLLGITTTSSPFNNIGSAATMTMDLTNGTNNIGHEYKINSEGSDVNNPELGEAYFVFVNQKSIYGGVNNLYINDVNQDNQIINSGYDNIQSGSGDIPYINDNTNIDIELYEGKSNKKLIVNGNNNLIIRFRVKAKSNNDNIGIESFTLSPNIKDFLNDVDKLSIYVGSEEITNDHKNIDNNGKIIVSGISKKINTDWTIVEIKYNGDLNYHIIDYSLSEVNGKTVDISSKKGFITTYLYPISFNKLDNGKTLYNFGFIYNEHKENIVGFTLFSSGEVIKGPIDFIDIDGKFEINGGDTPIIIDAYGYGCPNDVTNIEQCEFKILKNDFEHLFKVKDIDLQVF